MTLKNLNIKYFKKAIPLMILIFVSLNSFTQQSSLSSHYFLQEHIINPAITGSRNYNPIFVNYRNQWTGFNASPETYSISSHYAIDHKFGVGGGFFNDKMGGAYQQAGGQLNFANHFHFKNNGLLSYGTGLIFNQFSGDYSNLDPNDPTLQIGNESKSVFDIAAGIQYIRSNFRIGFSSNNILESNISNNGLLPENNRLKRVYHLMGSFYYNIDSNFAIEPYFLVKTILINPVQIDASILIHIKNLMTFGVSYRSGDALSLSTGVSYKNALLLYSYDITTSAAQGFTGQTHEITLGFKLPGKGGLQTKDSDNDGVKDIFDHCPDLAGPVENNGCPYKDTDGDGVLDKNDLCPDLAGPADNNGCPYKDSDGDGVLDKDDLCPDLKGIQSLKGCPDSDNDGISDKEDKCPEKAGPKENNGCPLEKLHILDDQFTNIDMIKKNNNSEFRIADLPLNKKYYFQLETINERPASIFISFENDGNVERLEATLGKSGYYELNEFNKEEIIEVELEEEEQKIVDEAFGSLEFETAKDIIKKESYPSLFELGKLLINNEDYRVSFTGHTDNVGDDLFNMQLSKRRAESVKKFMIDLGIKSNRIVVDFYGETKPIDTNETEEGKSRNRRVDILIIY